MAIHPIDLQTMYSQMDTVARTVANQQQGVQLAQQLQENGKIQKMVEQTSTVQKTADNETKSMNIKDDSDGSENNHQKKEKKDSEEADSPNKKNEIRESYLGQHIDITR